MVRLQGAGHEVNGDARLIGNEGLCAYAVGYHDSRTEAADRVRGRKRAPHLCPRAERAYVDWIRRYIRYHGVRHPSELEEDDIVAYPDVSRGRATGVAVHADASVECDRTVVRRSTRNPGG